MTFATLRALHALIAQAIDDIERVFAEHGRPLEFPSLEDPVYHPPAPAHQRQHHSAPPGEDAAERAGRDGAEDADGGADLAGGDREDRQRQDDAQARRQAAEALLATHPAVMAATNRIVAAAGHLAACVRDPFLSLCDASMGYHLPACMRFLEATHIVEVLREAGEAGEAGEGDGGMHVSALSARIGVPAGRLAHILRLLATHHILTERAPDVFANNRLSSRLDSGKRAAELLGCSPSCSCCSGCSPGCCSPGSPGSLAACACASSPEGKCPESAHPACENPPRAHGDELARSRTEKEKDPAAKYAGTNGVAAFVGLCTDELFKAAAYMAEAYVPALAPRPPAPAPSPPLSPSPSPSAAAAASPSAGAAAAAPAPEEVEVAPFGHAFGTRAGYFAWLEEGGRDPRLSPVLPFVPSPTSPASPASPSFSFSLAPSADSGLGWGADGADGRGGVQAQETRKGSVGSGVGVGRGADAEEGLWLKGKGNKGNGKNANANGNGNGDGNALAQTQTQPASPPAGSRRRFRLERFGKAMTGSSAWEPPAGLLNSAFDWASLAPGSTLVDVGGGVGSASIALAAHLGTRVRFVVQDRERVCAMGRAACEPGLLERGVVRFDAHDFFARQPIADPAVFLLRAILHDWPDNEAARILRRLRDAAGAGTRLILAAPAGAGKAKAMAKA
ncbi:hypothetical protein FIBSPDRAFT_944685 [Athelia psychrophila]|uniref:O-methyltransferase C-terminal domain-containing protein n=1 Tax=Athelia psychrophila TaxID=1759441 RepID=A0A166UX64_9AGAM|nr:hypothetical protein FIBSPDRAFT_944685 [Fibularhizoctonia sp. CBS 109695]